MTDLAHPAQRALPAHPAAHGGAASDAQAQAPEALMRWLRAVVWSAAVLPLLAFSAAAWWGHREAYEEAKAGALNASVIAARHAESVFKTSVDAIERVRALTSRPDAEIRLREAELHERLKDLALGLPAGSRLSVMSAQGRLLAAGNLYPVDPNVDYTDRPYFQQLRRDPLSKMFVSDAYVGRQSKAPAFSIALPRRTVSGQFNGVLLATLPPSHFNDFYKNLAPQASLNSFALVREDGALITRWPQPATDTPRIALNSPLRPHMSAGTASGVIPVVSTFDGERRLISFQRVPELPLYVAAGLSEASILANWYRYLMRLGAILLPTTLALVYVAWLALQRVRRLQLLQQALDVETQKRTQAELALVQAQKLEALGHLTGGVAHDFNNLLAIVSNNVHVMKRSLPQCSAASGPLASIERATASGVKLIRQLLSFSRKQALAPERLVLQEWLPAVVDLLHTTLGSNIALAVDVAPDTAPILVDAAELEIALINLSVNAKHAMPDGGALEISAATEAGPSPRLSRPGRGPGVVIRITDSGTGIAPEVIARVFEPFFTTKPAGAGTGLGLSQVYGLCAQAGGSASVESKLGVGTTVSLHFPADTGRSS